VDTDDTEDVGGGLCYRVHLCLNKYPIIKLFYEGIGLSKRGQRVFSKLCEEREAVFDGFNSMPRFTIYVKERKYIYLKTTWVLFQVVNIFLIRKRGEVRFNDRSRIFSYLIKELLCKILSFFHNNF
jgi:hypothetical protein